MIGHMIILKNEKNIELVPLRHGVIAQAQQFQEILRCNMILFLHSQ